MRALMTRQSAGVVRGMYRDACRLWRDESGTATVEYALLVSLIVAGSVGAWAGLHATLENVFERAVNAIGGATDTP